MQEERERERDKEEKDKKQEGLGTVFVSQKKGHRIEFPACMIDESGKLCFVLPALPVDAFTVRSFFCFLPVTTTTTVHTPVRETNQWRTETETGMS